MSDLTPKTSSKGEASRQQEARIPAPTTGNIDTNHDAEKSKNGGDETILQEKERIAGRSRAVHAKKAVPADDYKSPSGVDETILQEKQRIAGRSRAVHAKKAVPADDNKVSSGVDETILQEKERIAGRSMAIHAKKAVPADDYKLSSGVDTILNLDSDQATPGAFRIGDQDNNYDTSLHVDPEQTNTGALRIGVQDNDDDENTLTYSEEVRSHGMTTDVFKVIASLVEEDPEVNIGIAVVAVDEGGSRERLVYILIGISIILGIVLGVAIVLGLTLTTRSSQSGTTPSPTPSPTSSPTSPPTPAPTPAPTSLQRDSMIALIQSRSAATTFSNSVSPQNKALDWILSDSYSSGGLSDDRLVQRFALATLYYSMDGGNWDHGGWLNSINECNWDSEDFNLCSQESMVQQLYLGRDNLSGRFPIEIALLTQLNNLSLWGNNLTGSIPSELSILTQLTTLSLSNNKLTGSIPSEIGLLTQLTQLDIEGNELTGSIPSSLCPAELFRIDCGEIACTCCRDISTGVSCPSA